MKTKAILFLIALLPFVAIAGSGEKKKEKIDVKITLDKKGKIEVSGLSGDLKELQDDINEAMKDVNVEITGNKKNREVHIKVEIEKEK